MSCGYSVLIRKNELSSQTNTIEEVQMSTMERVVALHAKRNSKAYSGSALVEKVYDYVVENIRRGNWLSGVKIAEAKVASELGISHIPVREAMERLQQDGWIDRIANRGAFVKKLDINVVCDLFQIREMVETGSVRAIAETITDEQLDELKSVSDLCDSAREINNMDISQKADIHFHRLLVHFTGNARLESMFESILLQSRGAFFDDSHGTPFYTQLRGLLQAADHSQIYQSLASHDTVKAEQLIREHIRIGRVSAVKFCELFSEVSNGGKSINHKTSTK
jgi:DNA-binding GntR family transcriptional regulator